MGESCSKAHQSSIGAAYVLGQLLIWAEGQKPTPCHKVRIEHWPFRIYPPQYQIVACVDEGVICPQVVVPYKAFAVFSLSEETLKAMGGVAIVHDRDGAQKVPVTMFESSPEQAKALAGDQAGAGGGMPFPFAVTRDLPFPFRFERLLETGRVADLDLLPANKIALHTATGYSNAFSFEEAFKNAIANLPPDTDPFPDKLTNVTVVGVGANFGGIAGLNRMYVTVNSFY